MVRGRVSLADGGGARGGERMKDFYVFDTLIIMSVSFDSPFTVPFTIYIW